MREVASKTSDIAGDGTTTATVLAQAIYREGAKNVVAGANPMEIKRGIEQAVEVITAELKKMSKPVRGAMVAQVGSISANNDETIGTIIAQAMDKVGKDGVIFPTCGRLSVGMTRVSWIISCRMPHIRLHFANFAICALKSRVQLAIVPEFRLHALNSSCLPRWETLCAKIHRRRA